ncbi:hypothetical protein AOQ84DRAFT_224558 [Glonium stellatum]|uniref:Uncharacterized protein n=1 Tax=Glonium stellatum TaxID=574774 RepID=A0A8E2JQC1_9PEZI|nr:hypothetical protein AOQ84DRAFT_224558 [Glonium stellatum]
MKSAMGGTRSKRSTNERPSRSQGHNGSRGRRAAASNDQAAGQLAGHLWMLVDAFWRHAATMGSWGRSWVSLRVVGTRRCRVQWDGVLAEDDATFCRESWQFTLVAGTRRMDKEEMDKEQRPSKVQRRRAARLAARKHRRAASAASAASAANAGWQLAAHSWDSLASLLLVAGEASPFAYHAMQMGFRGFMRRTDQRRVPVPHPSSQSFTPTPSHWTLRCSSQPAQSRISTLFVQAVRPSCSSKPFASSC